MNYEVGYVNNAEVKLFYKMTGSGPLLVLLSGGAGDADSYDILTPYLAPHFTVVTYDRRGYARSPLHSTPQVTSIKAQSDDVARLIAHLSSMPAFVFGSSIGATISLELTTRHSEKVRFCLAHEPPLPQLMDDKTMANSLLVNHPDEPAKETINRFAASLGIEPGTFATGVRDRQAESKQNAAYFLKYEAPALTGFSLDLIRLKSSSSTIVFAGGKEGKEFFPYQCGLKAAQATHRSFVEFPGKHNGFSQYPEAFATQLLAVFNGKKE